MLGLWSVEIDLVFIFWNHNLFLLLYRTRYNFLLTITIKWVFVIRPFRIHLLNWTFFDEAWYESLIYHGLLFVFTLFFLFHKSVITFFRHPRGVSTWWRLGSCSTRTTNCFIIGRLLGRLRWRGLISPIVFITGWWWMTERDCQLSWRFRLLLLVIVVHQISLKLKLLRLILI